VYNRMSPFSYADKIKTPLLMIHGEADNNPGTFPIQSERLYNAIKGHGGTVRFVQLPFESHGYAAKENILHLLWEQHQWLEKYVKNAPAGNNAAAAATPVPGENPELQKIKMLTYSAPTDMPPLYILDGKEIPGLDKVDTNKIERIDVLKDDSAKKKYGDKGQYGVVEITMKK
jgi:hypothetical protein